MPTPAPTTAPAARTPLRVREVAASWAPLAGSWLLMGLELPAVSAVMARLPDPKLSLAAYGGVVFPLALLIESPIIMLLAASTALSRDHPAYRTVRRYMQSAAGALTVGHSLVAFTPLFDLVIVPLLGVPEPVREPARIGLRIMLPWTLSIAYRRTQQGVLIRFGRPRAVTIGTAVRLSTNACVLAIGWAHGGVPGIVVGTSAVACGVIAEAVYAGWAVRPVLAREMPAEAAGDPLTMPAFLRFYAPLMLTPLILFAAMPLASAAMSRMPRALDSLAAWPVLSGITFTLRSLGFAYNEVVVAKLDAWRPVPALRRFALLLAAATSAVLLAAATTPLGVMWFGRVSALSPSLAALAAAAFVLMIPLPGVSALQSWYTGAIVHGRRTRAVTESVVAMLATTAAVLGVGIATQRWPGIAVASAALVLGNVAQLAWLGTRARGEIAAVVARDRVGDSAGG